MGLDHPHTKAGVGEFGVAISGGVWVAIREGAMCKEPEDLLWFAEAPRPMSYDVDGKIILRKKGPVPDSLLRPIRGRPLGADIALGITGLPARSIA